MSVNQSNLDNPTLRKFFLQGVKFEVKKGEYVIRPEEEPSGIFYIESGHIKATNNTKYGEENLLVIRKHGEIFPLIWVITGDNRRVGYVAHTDSVVYRRTQEELEAMSHDSPDALREILLVTTIMYQTQAERVNSLVYRTVRERVAYFLLTLTRRFGVKTKAGILIDIPLTRSDIAASVSATRETVSRELSGFMRKGIVVQEDGNKILVSKVEDLKKII